jgi:hypothetical protein
MAQDPEQQDWAKLYGQLMVKAWQDETFKQRLLGDPKATLAEHGIPVPAGHEVRVLENSPQVTHLVLPPKPDEVPDVVGLEMIPPLLSPPGIGFFAGSVAKFKQHKDNPH